MHFHNPWKKSRVGRICVFGRKLWPKRIGGLSLPQFDMWKWCFCLWIVTMFSDSARPMQHFVNDIAARSWNVHLSTCHAKTSFSQVASKKRRRQLWNLSTSFPPVYSSTHCTVKLFWFACYSFFFFILCCSSIRFVVCVCECLCMCLSAPFYVVNKMRLSQSEAYRENS